MTSKEFLRRVRTIDRQVDEAQERVDRIRAKLEAGRMNRLTGMPRGGSGDWTQTADRLIELEQRINAKTRDMVRWKLAAIEAIDALEDIRLRELMQLYYIDGMTWQQVADRMGMKDVRWAYVLHGRALLRIQIPKEILNNSL